MLIGLGQRFPALRIRHDRRDELQRGVGTVIEGSVEFAAQLRLFPAGLVEASSLLIAGLHARCEVIRGPST